MSKLKLFLLIIFTFVMVPIYSQVAMQLDISKKNFIQYENIFVTLKLRNLSSHPLVFGQNKQLSGKLQFIVRNENGERIKLRKGAKEDFLYGTILSPGKTTKLSLSLSQVYAINKPGKYRVKAVISHYQLSNAFASNSISFKVTNGVLVWDVIVGVPTTEALAPKAKILKRTYALKSYFDGDNRVYCLIVSDRDYVYGIARIGIDIGGKIPEYLIDDYSRIHILVQEKNKRFRYYIFDSSCNLDRKEQYDGSKSIPGLNIDDKTGEVDVLGGKLIIDEID